MVLHAGSDAMSKLNEMKDDEVALEDLEVMAERDGFVLEDKDDLTRYLRKKRFALPLISEALVSLRGEFPGASFTVSYSDDRDPFVTIMVYDVRFLGERYRRLREIATGIYLKADDLGAALLIMPGV